MTFLAGVLVGVVLGLGLGVLLGRRPPAGIDPGTSAGTDRRPYERRGIATGIAAVALVVAAVALARSGRHEHSNSAAAATSTTVSSTSAPALASSTTGGSIGATVTVPNVVTLSRELAVARLEQAGLRASVDSLALANVPPGFVISQNPLPAGLVARGTVVALVVSAST